MFRKHRSLYTVALVVAVILLTTLPAAAGGTAQPAQPAGPSTETLWGKWIEQVLAWIGSPGGGQPVAATDTGSQIDPFGVH